MDPDRALSTGIRRAFAFSGRASRAEYWLFAPVGLGIAAVGCFLPLPELDGDLGFWTRALVIVVFACPLLSATWRRLQDTGENGAEAMRPLTPFVLLIAVFWLIHAAFAITLGGIPLVLIPVLFVVFWLWVLAGVAIALIWIGPILGQLLLPSEPDPNRYGPNPLEVNP